MANEENIRKWVDALRSGKYQQTTGKLSDGQAYCCLGVACEVAIESGVALERKLEADDPNDFNGRGRVVYGDQGGELPEAVANWLGLLFEDDYGEFLPFSDPELTSEGACHTTAVEWNDDANADFAKIADLIEANYLAKGEPSPSVTRNQEKTA